MTASKGVKPYVARKEIAWNAAQDAELLRLFSSGMVDAEIGPLMGRTPRAIKSRRNMLRYLREGMEDYSWSRPSSDWAALQGRKFQDITRAEARAVSANAPRSGRFDVREPRFSEMGSTAAMCCGRA